MSATETAVAQTWILWRQQGGSKIAARQQKDGVDRNSETAATVAETATAAVTVMAGMQTWIEGDSRASARWKRYESGIEGDGTN